MKIVLLFIFLFSSAGLGYQSGLKEQQTHLQNELIKELSTSSTKPPAKSLAYALSVVADHMAHLNGEANTTQTAVELALNQIPLSPHESDLHDILNRNPAEVRLMHLLIAKCHSSDLPGVDVFVSNAIDNMKQDPNLTMKEIENALDRLPPSNFAVEHAALLDLMNQTTGDSLATKNQAISELTQYSVPARQNPALANSESERNAALSTTDDMILPIVAHSIFLMNTQDPLEALNGTVQGIKSQPNAGVEIALASQFLHQFPQMKPQFGDALTAQGINLSIQGM